MGESSSASEGAQRVVIGDLDVLGHRGGADSAVPDGVGRHRVQDAGQQAAAAEAGHAGDVAQHLGLHRQAEGQRRLGDVFGGAALAVDA